MVMAWGVAQGSATCQPRQAPGPRSSPHCSFPPLRLHTPVPFWEAHPLGADRADPGTRIRPRHAFPDSSPSRLPVTSFTPPFS